MKCILFYKNIFKNIYFNTWLIVLEMPRGFDMSVCRVTAGLKSPSPEMAFPNASSPPALILFVLIKPKLPAWPGVENDLSFSLYTC